MARITQDDCLKKFPSRFSLIIDASERARQLAVYGKEPLVDWNNDKPTVVALREFAAESEDDNSEDEHTLDGQGSDKEDQDLHNTLEIGQADSL